MSPRAKPVARVPLFDRLIDEESRGRSEVAPFRMLSAEGLKTSVRREIARILNTRSPLEWEEFMKRPLSVIDFGLPDFSGWSVQDPRTLQRLSGAIERALDAFEPRIDDVRVEVRHDRSTHRLVVDVACDLPLGGEVEAVSFRDLSVANGDRRT